MLTRLKLTNFKSWQDTGDIALKPITGFFGPNSSGKTSLLQALLLLKQTTDSADRGLALQFGDDKTRINLGDFRSVIYGHADNAELGVALNWELTKPSIIRSPKEPASMIISSRHFGFSTRVRGENGSGKALRLRVPEITYQVGDARLGMRARGSSAKYDLFAEQTNFRFIRTHQRVWPLPEPVKCYGFPDQVHAYYQNAGFLSDLELALEEQLKTIYYLGPLRAYPQRAYTWTGANPSDMGQAGEQAINALLASRDRGETISLGRGRRKVNLEEYVARWLKRLGLIADFRVEPVSADSQIFQVKVRKTDAGPEVLITDVGFGVSQILPVLVLCFYVPEGSTIILEQPEIHLHPAVQAELADVLIDAYRIRRVQIILESHSEHLLRRLQRRIAEESINRDELALYFCQVGERHSVLTPLQLDLFGRISNWPEGFFGDEFGEIASIQEAIQSRKLREQVR